MPEPESDPTPLSRIELLRLAQSLGVSDADVMTRAELRAAIEKAKAPAPAPIEHPTTWVSVARRLLASVIERGLNLPDAAALIRGDAKLTTPPKAPPPVATVTLARIYAAQGHLDRAINTLDEVLESDPDHELARDLRAQLELRRQESLARDADAAPSVRPEEELTPIMPEVALREAERGATASVERADRTTTDPAPAPAEGASEPAASNAIASESLGTTPAASEPATVEPTAGQPAAGQPAAGEPALALLAALSSQVAPPSQAAPSSDPPGELVAPAFAVAERAEAMATSGDATPSAGIEAAESTQAPPSDAAHGEPEATFNAKTESGIENGVAHGASRAIEPAAPSDARSGDVELAPVSAAPIAAEVLPEVPGLVLIEADKGQYLYWELGSSGAAPCWLHVVSHAPAVDGHTERRERRFPVQQRRGALRIEGVPADAVVRAKLSRDPDGRPVAVAGAVRSHDATFQIQFCPHPRAPLEAIARRAEPVLARATPVYWDC